MDAEPADGRSPPRLGPCGPQARLAVELAGVVPLADAGLVRIASSPRLFGGDGAAVRDQRGREWRGASGPAGAALGSPARGLGQRPCRRFPALIRRERREQLQELRHGDPGVTAETTVLPHRSPSLTTYRLAPLTVDEAPRWDSLIAPFAGRQLFHQ